VVLDVEKDDNVGRFPVLIGDLRVVMAGVAEMLEPLDPFDKDLPPNRGNARHNWMHAHGLA
jgi:hypothetical protein